MIRKIAKQATSNVMRNTPSFLMTNEMWQDEFAKLVIEEMYVYMCNTTDNDKPWPNFEEIKQHFGIEE